MLSKLHLGNLFPFAVRYRQREVDASLVCLVNARCVPEPSDAKISSETLLGQMSGQLTSEWRMLPALSIANPVSMAS